MAILLNVKKGLHVMRLQKSSLAQTDKIKENLVVMNLITMNCFLLNEAAAVLWEALDYFEKREDLVSLLVSAEVPEPATTFDNLAAQLLEAGLIEQVPA